MQITDLEAIKKLTAMTIEEALAFMESSDKGLSAAEIPKRQGQFGPNTMTKTKSINLVKLFVQQFTHFMALMLWAAGFMALFVGMPELAIATWSVILINALFSFFQEYRADKALSKLATMLPSTVKTLRDGSIFQIPADQLTLGDVISLSAGDQIPADSRLILTKSFSVDMSMLTGESVPVHYEADPCTLEDKPITESTNLVFAGTMVTEGDSQAIVYAIGNDTEIGKVSKLTQTIVRGQSTLEVEIKKIVRFITAVALIMGMSAFAVAVFSVGLDVRIGFIFAIGIIVANIPEGLLPTVSLTLAVGVQRMAKRNALVRRLSSIETLSATSVICTDKTGTITENKLTVVTVWTPDSSISIAGSGYEKAGEVTYKTDASRDTLEMLMTIGVICTEAEIRTDEKTPEIWDIFGDPTEAAILIAAEKCGVDTQEEKKKFERQITIPFNSARKMMSVVVKNLGDSRFPENGRMVFTKGAPLEVINTCKHLHAKEAGVDFTPELKQQIVDANDDLANQGFRVIAVSYEMAENAEEAHDDNMVFLGLIAMIDPPRPEVFEAIKSCRDAGVKITIITGDYGLTSVAIAKQIGMIEDKFINHTGGDLDAFSDEDLLNVLQKEEPLVFSRTNPEHKLRIVEAYKTLGRIVAVTGDGVNDTLALKSAHIGIAMGKSGTDVAREVADMVLLDDNFATIIMAIEEGRSIYDNIRKFMTYVLTSNIAEFAPYGFMLLGRVPPALNILQIIAIDLGTDMVPALALGAESPEKDILKRPPRNVKDPLLDKGLFIRAYAFLGVIEATLSLWVFMTVWAHAGYGLADLQGITSSILDKSASPEIMTIYRYATTMTLASIVACQIGNVFVCRSERLHMWQMFSNRNKLIWIGVASEVILTALIIFTPFLASVFQTVPLKFSDLGILLLCPLILIVLEESRKFISNRMFKRKH